MTMQCALLQNAERRRLHGRRGLKLNVFGRLARILLSPPSRAAWIEILLGSVCYNSGRVAAFTGGVD